MNKFSLYILLILIFLGLSKSFSPSEQKTDYLVNERVFSSFFRGSPLSIVLVDTFRAGFLIKTFYLKLEIVHGFKQPEQIIVRTSEHYYKRLTDKIGMSIFRRHERGKEESTTAMPPGSIYVGDPSFGHWDYLNSGKKAWFFHRAYRHFPRIFKWGDFRPDFEFYQRVKIHEKNEKSFFGVNNEFGTDGSISKKFFHHEEQKIQNRMKVNIKTLFKKYLSMPEGDRR